MIYYLKYMHYTSMIFNIGKFLFFKKSQMHNSSFNDVSLSNVKLYAQLHCRKFFKHVVPSIVGSKNKVKQSQKLISNNSIIKQLLSPIHTAQVNRIGFVKKQKSFKKNSDLLPSVDLLSVSPFLTKSTDIDHIMEIKSRLLESKLSEYHIRANVVNVLRGPVVTRFELELAPGLKSSRISSLSRDLARSLSICNLRIIEIIPGKPYVGLEIPNDKRETIHLREILDSDKFRMACSFLTLGFGKDIAGVPVVADLINMPHLLIAGTTGSGKSVGINNMIISILYKATPENVCFIMIDSKILELSIYNGIPHLIRSVVTDINSVIDVLNWCVKEMQRRYKVMAYCGVRNLKSYNDRMQSGGIHKFTINNPSIFMLKMLPHIVIIIDEFADLVLSGGKEVESLIVCLSQKSRACGMHLILATQRPSVNVITGLIKANIPSRIAFTVSSKVDSRIILDQSGAESLLGMGDMLYLGPGSSIPIRIHGAFVSDDEVSLIVRHWQNIFNKNSITL